MVFLIAITASIFTLLGGVFALRLKDKLHLILGFSAGTVISVALFDLLPESLNLGSHSFQNSEITGFVAVGFLVYLVLDRTIFLMTYSVDHEHVTHEHNHDHSKGRGMLAAASLCLHSFLDGVAIGLAFQLSEQVGIIVAIAVLIHDFSDGINTVNFILKDSSQKKKAVRWLIADAIAPALGVISTLFFTLPEKYLAVLLAVFCGFFLYIGASELIPESHHKHPRFFTTAMTILGALVMYIAITFAGN